MAGKITAPTRTYGQPIWEMQTDQGICHLSTSSDFAITNITDEIEIKINQKFDTELSQGVFSNVAPQ